MPKHSRLTVEVINAELRAPVSVNAAAERPVLELGATGGEGLQWLVPLLECERDDVFREGRHFDSVD